MVGCRGQAEFQAAVRVKPRQVCVHAKHANRRAIARAQVRQDRRAS
jgi:hypothetical protein